MKEFDEDLTAAERSALAQLRQDIAPPESLEPRVLEALKAGGLLRTSQPAFHRARLLALAAAVVAFGLGLWVGSRGLPRGAAPGATGQTRYLLLLEGPGDPSPEEESRRVEEYKRWARSVAESGHAIAGEKLRPEVLRLGPGLSSLERENSVRGFFVVSAKDDREALEIAGGCPHLLHGGRIIVRPIDPV